MKIKIKKWIGLVIALLLILGMFGCSEEDVTIDSNVAKEGVSDLIEEDMDEQKSILLAEEEKPESIKQEAIHESEQELQRKEQEESQLESQTKVQEEPQNESEVKVEVEPEPQIESEPQIQPEPQVQPESQVQPEPQVEPEPQIQPEPQVILQQTPSGAYAVNAKNGKIHIVGQCPATGNGDSAMEMPVYFDTYEAAEVYSIQYHANQKKRQCGNCW